jgi:hypothetical protein
MLLSLKRQPCDVVIDALNKGYKNDPNQVMLIFLRHPNPDVSKPNLSKGHIAKIKCSAGRSLLGKSF